jgi:four helix bundle protein
MRAGIGMPKSPDLRVRSFDFAVAIGRICKSELTDDPIARRLAYQLVGAAGSVGANLEESRAGQTKPDFIAKQFIALKEARESRFWLKVIATSYPRTAEKLAPLIEESSELVAMLTASIKTAKSNPLRGVAVAGIEPR